jgi:malonyl-CoA/methylmalonyl-CoA synthetase
VTLTAAWFGEVTTRAHQVALLTPDGAISTWADLEAVTRRAAERLVASGLRPGDRVLLSCAPSVDTVIAYVALLRCGVTVVPANTAYTGRELQHIVTVTRPRAAIIDEPERLSEVAPSPELVVPPTLAGCAEPVDVVLDLSRGDDPALIGFTSGTTGQPKGAVLSHDNLLAGARSVVEAWEWTPADRLICALPLFHMHGLGVAVNGTLTAGASMVILPRFDPADIVAASTNATMLFGVPTMWARLVDAAVLPHLRHLRLLVSGSAPLDPTLFEAIRADAGQAPLERYGMTETVMLAGNPLHGQRRAGSVGVPMPGVDLRIADDGEVQVRGPNVFRGYLDQPDASAAAFTADGWFRTGDVGELSSDGHLTLVGRTSELIISGGYNVYPREVEDALLAYSGVIDAAVVGTPDREWGEVVTACVVLAPWADVDSVADSLVETLASYKRPRRWRIVDEVPRNAMGKVIRAELRE